MAAKSKPNSRQRNRSARRLARSLIPQQESLPRRGLPFMKSSRQRFFRASRRLGRGPFPPGFLGQEQRESREMPLVETRQLQISEQAAPFCFIPSSSRSEHFIFWNSSFTWNSLSLPLTEGSACESRIERKAFRTALATHASNFPSLSLAPETQIPAPGFRSRLSHVSPAVALANRRKPARQPAAPKRRRELRPAQCWAPFLIAKLHALSKIFWSFKAVGTRAISARLPRPGTARVAGNATC